MREHFSNHRKKVMNQTKIIINYKEREGENHLCVIIGEGITKRELNLKKRGKKLSILKPYRNH